MDSAFERIYKVVEKIPRGKVCTYGQVARMAGSPRWARVVGYALHANPRPGVIPCHRVVNHAGRLAPGWAEQRDLLEREGVSLKDETHVDIKKYQWSC